MPKAKIPFLLFGVVVGLAIGAALIGLLLIAVAAVTDLQAGAASLLTQHPLFVLGSELMTASLVAGLPMFGIWYAWRKQ
jgi:hypothetical protein